MVAAIPGAAEAATALLPWRLLEDMNSRRGDIMRPELTPTEARSGVISGRIFTILMVSSVGAVAAMAVAWYLLSTP